MDKLDTSTVTDERMRRALETPVSELGLDARIVNALDREGILLVNDLLHTTQKELRAISGMADKRIEAIFDALAQLGFSPRNERRDK